MINNTQDIERTITLNQMELSVDVQDKVYEACTLGRDKNIIVNKQNTNIIYHVILAIFTPQIRFLLY